MLQRHDQQKCEHKLNVIFSPEKKHLHLKANDKIIETWWKKFNHLNVVEYIHGKQRPDKN